LLRGHAQYIDGGIEFRDGAGGFDIGVLWGIDFELKAVALPAIPDGPIRPTRDQQFDLDHWLILGLLGLVQVFVDRATPWIWSLLSGLVGILAGLLVLRHPLLAALTVPTVIVLILGIEGLAMGVLQIIGAFKGGGAGPFILGAINILVGILLLSSPIAAALAVPLVFGVLLLIQGVGLIILAFRVRSSL
jgi:hypothetical protein